MHENETHVPSAWVFAHILTRALLRVEAALPLGRSKQHFGGFFGVVTFALICLLYETTDSNFLNRGNTRNVNWNATQRQAQRLCV